MQVLLNSKTVGSHHLAVVWVIKSFQELNACALATATTAHKGKSLARAHFHLQSPQHLDVRSAWISKPAVYELNPTLKVILQQTRGGHYFIYYKMAWCDW